MLPRFLILLHFAQGPTASSPSILQLSGCDISADLQACVGESQRYHSPTPTSSTSARAPWLRAWHGLSSSKGHGELWNFAIFTFTGLDLFYCHKYGASMFP